MSGLVELEMPAKPEYLTLARLVVATAASIEPTFRDEKIEDLRVAVSEATTNAIEAHARMSGEDRITIRCDLADDRIEVEVRDEGPGFDPSKLEPVPQIADPDRLEFEGGFGIPLMHELADETEIRSSDEGTAVKLVVTQKRA